MVASPILTASSLPALSTLTIVESEDDQNNGVEAASKGRIVVVKVLELPSSNSRLLFDKVIDLIDKSTGFNGSFLQEIKRQITERINKDFFIE